MKKKEYIIPEMYQHQVKIQSLLAGSPGDTYTPGSESGDAGSDDFDAKGGGFFWDDDED